MEKKSNEIIITDKSADEITTLVAQIRNVIKINNTPMAWLPIFLNPSTK